MRANFEGTANKGNVPTAIRKRLQNHNALQALPMSVHWLSFSLPALAKWSVTPKCSLPQNLQCYHRKSQLLQPSGEELRGPNKGTNNWEGGPSFHQYFGMVLAIFSAGPSLIFRIFTMSLCFISKNASPSICWKGMDKYSYGHDPRARYGITITRSTSRISECSCPPRTQAVHRNCGQQLNLSDCINTAVFCPALTLTLSSQFLQKMTNSTAFSLVVFTSRFSQETQCLAPILTDKFVKCICRNRSYALTNRACQRSEISSRLSPSSIVSMAVARNLCAGGWGGGGGVGQARGATVTPVSRGVGGACSPR